MKKILIIIQIVCCLAMAYSIYTGMGRGLIACFSFLTGYCFSISIVVFIGKEIADHHIAVIKKQEQDAQEAQKIAS